VAKSFRLRLALSLVLSLVLLAISRKISSRTPLDVSTEFEGITVKHRTVTESRTGEIRQVTVSFDGDTRPVRNGFIYYNFAGENPKRTEMRFIDSKTLSGDLPEGKRGQKLYYRIELMGDERFLTSLPPIGQPGYLVKFKGHAAPIILISHIVLLFVAVFLAFLAFFIGKDLVKGVGRPKTAFLIALSIFLCTLAGGIIIGPVVTYQTFGEGWGGWPIGKDITDTKTEIFLFFWLVAVIIGIGFWRGSRPFVGDIAYGYFIMFCFVITLVAFLIPHSL